VFTALRGPRSGFTRYAAPEHTPIGSFAAPEAIVRYLQAIEVGGGLQQVRGCVAVGAGCVRSLSGCLAVGVLLSVCCCGLAGARVLHGGLPRGARRGAGERGAAAAAAGRRWRGRRRHAGRRRVDDDPPHHSSKGQTDTGLLARHATRGLSPVWPSRRRTL
jgi:hypothetical protein